MKPRPNPLIQLCRKCGNWIWTIPQLNCVWDGKECVARVGQV